MSTSCSQMPHFSIFRSAGKISYVQGSLYSECLRLFWYLCRQYENIFQGSIPVHELKCRSIISAISSPAASLGFVIKQTSSAAALLSSGCSSPNLFQRLLLPISMQALYMQLPFRGIPFAQPSTFSPIAWQYQRNGPYRQSD